MQDAARKRRDDGRESRVPHVSGKVRRLATRMDILAESEGKVYGAVTIQRPDEFVSPFTGLPFPCSIWDHEGHFSHSDRFAVADALLESGCRYAVCGGQQCSAWHDAIDEEWIARHIDEPEEVQEAAQVMTTWHRGETPDDVAFFFVLSTIFDGHDFGQYLVLHVGSGPATEQLEAAVRKYALNKKEP